MLTVPVAAFALGPSSIEIEKPVPRSFSSELEPLQVGDQVILATSILNNDKATPFFVVMEARDSDGFTAYLSWANGTVNAGEDMAIGLAWVPQKADDYMVRAFVLTDITRPVPLSTVAESHIVIEPK